MRGLASLPGGRFHLSASRETTRMLPAAKSLARRALVAARFVRGRHDDVNSPCARGLPQSDRVTSSARAQRRRRAASPVGKRDGSRGFRSEDRAQAVPCQRPGAVLRQRPVDVVDVLGCTASRPTEPWSISGFGDSGPAWRLSGPAPRHRNGADASDERVSGRRGPRPGHRGPPGAVPRRGRPAGTRAYAGRGRRALRRGRQRRAATCPRTPRCWSAFR